MSANVMEIDGFLKDGDLHITLHSSINPTIAANAVKTTHVVVTNYDAIESIALHIDGLDEILGKNTNLYSEGKAFLVINTNEGEKRIFMDDVFISIKKTKHNNISSEMIATRNSFIRSANQELYNLLGDIHALQETTHENTAIDRKKNDNGKLLTVFSSTKFKYGLGAIGVVLVGFMVSSFAANLANNDKVQTNDPSMTLDVKALTTKDDEQMDQMFKEIGIDRDALSSDLSCFSE